MDFILALAKHYDIYAPIHTTTIMLSKELNISQQSVSRILIELENDKLIKRESTQKGVIIHLQPKAISIIKETYESLKPHFSNNFQFQGKVIEGLGEGKYYISQEEYKKRFKEKLNITPYEGTLNVEVDPNIIKKIKNSFNKIHIEGFSTLERSFSAVDCYKCKINNIDAFIIIIERTSHKENIIEIISEEYLRPKIKDTITIEMVKT